MRTVEDQTIEAIAAELVQWRENGPPPMDGPPSPDGPGVYALFLAPGASLPGIESGEEGLLYIGMSEARLGTRDHIGGHEHSGGSTVRRSIGAMLKSEDFRLEAEPRAAAGSGKDCVNYRFTNDGEQRLTEWMQRHLICKCYAVAWDKVRQVEKGLIERFRPPLNLTGWENPQRATIKRRRKQCMKEAIARARAGSNTGAISPTAVHDPKHPAASCAESREELATNAAAHFQNSTLRERIVEHVFVGDALRELWRHGILDVEVLRSEFDAHGYDLVMARGRIVRHIQFKTGTSQKPGPVSVSQSLAEKPSGCVIWIRVTPDLAMGPFFWFGGRPGEPLPAIAGYPNPLRTTHNKDGVRPLRQNHRAVPGTAFRKLETLHEVLGQLFGELPSGRPRS
jgi:hypothetical protein